jgi:hypothetical protein
MGGYSVSGLIAEGETTAADHVAARRRWGA